MNSNLNQWLEKAEELFESQDLTPQQHLTLDYLVRNDHTSVENVAPTSILIAYMHEEGFDYTTNAFQHEVLIPLKQLGVIMVLVNGPGGGVFVPSSPEDVKFAINKMLGRIKAEMGNLLDATEVTDFHEQLLGYKNQVDEFNID